MTIGERIKNLRKKNGLTQERLADYLCVSYQAVSKWECGSSCPDLALILPLAKILNVTSDELLGANAGNDDVRYEELERLHAETFKSGDLDMRISLSETAIKEYPTDMKWLNLHAWDVWCCAVGKASDKEFEQERDKAIKLFDTVIKNTNDDEIKANAITGIVQCLCGKGSKKEARGYVELYPDIKVFPTEKEKLLGMCLEGEEQIRHKQHYLKDCFDILICTILWDGVSESKDVCSVAEEVLKAMIPDENYCNYHYEMAHIQFRKAEMAVQIGNSNDAIQLLKKCVYHAKEYDSLAYVNPGEYTFTAPLFNKLTYNSIDWYRTGDRSLLGDIKQMCLRKSMQRLHSHKDYQSLWI